MSVRYPVPYQPPAAVQPLPQIFPRLDRPLVNYSLTCEGTAVTIADPNDAILVLTVPGTQGAVLVAAQAATLLAARRLDAGVVAIAIGGQATTLSAGVNLAANAGAVAVGEQAATLTWDQVLDGAVAAVTVTGQAATLTWSQVLDLATAALAVTGQATTLTWSQVLDLAAGAVAVGGQNATLTVGGITTIVADPAAVTVGVQAATLTRTRLLSAEAVAAHLVTGSGVADSYPESNFTGGSLMHASTHWRKAQVFDVAESTILTRAVFYMARTGSPPNNVVAQLWAVDGNLTTGQPTGSVLATSATVVATTLPVSPTYALIEFDFSAAPVVLEPGRVYAIGVEYNNGDAGNYVVAGIDDSTPTHEGHLESYNGTNWVTLTDDVIFYVYGPDGVTLTATQSLQIAANAGAVAVDGTAATLLQASVLAAGTAGVAIGGQNATLSVSGATVLNADAGTVTVGVQAVTLLWAHSLVAAAGAVSIADPADAILVITIPGTQASVVVNVQNATLTYSAGPVITADATAVTIGGQNATLTYSAGATIAADTTAVTIGAQSIEVDLVKLGDLVDVQVAGQSVTLFVGTVLAANAGAVAVAVQGVTLTAGVTLVAGAGAVTISGENVTLTQARVLTASAGTVAIGAQNATLTVTGAVVLNADTASVAVGVQDLAVGITRRAETAPVTVGVQDATLSVSGITVLPANAGAVLVSAQAANVLWDHWLTATGLATSVAGQSATLARGYELAASAGAVAVADVAITLVWDQVLATSAGAVQIGGQNATLTFGSITVLGADFANVIATIEDAALDRSRGVVPGAADVQFAGGSVAFLRQYVLDAQPSGVAVAQQSVTLTYTNIIPLQYLQSRTGPALSDGTIGLALRDGGVGQALWE